MLSDSERDDFETHGYVRLPGFLPQPLLQRLRELFDTLLDPASATPDAVTVESNGQSYVTNVDQLCHRGNLAALELLGFPPMLELARSICGEDLFLIQEFAVIKHRGDETEVLWHKDMVHHRTGQCFTAGIYLDDAEAGDGALQVVPGSHLDPRDICALREEPAIDVPMQAGDVLIHDMMLAHASPPLRNNALRRVIYFEFLSAAQVARERIYAPELVARRTRLAHLAASYHAGLHPEAARFEFADPSPEPDDRDRPLREVLDEIYAAPINARPSSYCINGTAIFADFPT